MRTLPLPRRERIEVRVMRWRPLILTFSHQGRRNFSHTLQGKVSMSKVDFIKDYMRNLQNALDEAMKGLSDEQAHWRPNDNGNHIAFIAWHYTRTVDNIVRFVFQRQPTVWMEGKWDERFGLDSKSQGTGMALEDAVALRIGDIPAFCAYMGQVWKESQAYLDTISDEDLPRSMTIRPLGEMTLEQVLGTTLLTHGYSHLGEIWLLKGLQGLQGSPV